MNDIIMWRWYEKKAGSLEMLIASGQSEFHARKHCVPTVYSVSLTQYPDAPERLGVMRRVDHATPPNTVDLYAEQMYVYAQPGGEGM